MSQVVGLIADTHVPDTVRAIPEAALAVFRSAQVCCILHAGDIIGSQALRALEAIAPVYAVRGNRDFLLRGLPAQRELTLGDVRIGLAHGHGPWPRYIREKLRFWLTWRAPAYRTYVQRMLALFPRADVIVFGHIHYPLVYHFGPRWVINPGSPLGKFQVPGSVGLLHLGPARQIRPEIVLLPTAAAQARASSVRASARASDRARPATHPSKLEVHP
ncbi:MAG: YfcE family phosphodiesterase [Chloroflexi bacterium]|nr:YfcE family phosphodiesterase [Chloroflexota bacterium]